MGKNFQNSLGKYRRSSVPNKSAIDNDQREIEELKKENEKLREENNDLIAQLNLLSQQKDSDIEKLRSKIKAIESLNEIRLKESSIASKSQDMNDEILVYKNKELQSVGVTRLFKGLKAEEEVQGDKIKLTRNDMARKYFVNDAVITSSISLLESYGFIEIVQESPRKRYFRILKNLPFVNEHQ